MHNYSFEDAVRPQPPVQQEDTTHDWMDNIPRIAVSNDGYALVVHLPGAIKPKASVRTFTVITPTVIF